MKHIAIIVLLFCWVPAAAQSPDSLTTSIESDTSTVTTFKDVERKPTFLGGNERMFSIWVSRNLKYPQDARNQGITGRVVCSFVVDTTGKVVDVKVLQRVHPSLDSEAKRIISASPRWTPGIQRGKKVRVRYNFPVVFQTKGQNYNDLHRPNTTIRRGPQYPGRW